MKQRLSHLLSRIKSIGQWAVDPDPFMTLTTSAKLGKTAIQLTNRTTRFSAAQIVVGDIALSGVIMAWIFGKVGRILNVY